MNRLSLQERIELIECYFNRDQSPTLAIRSFMRTRKNSPSPSIDTIKNLVEKFRRTGSVADDLEGRKNKEKTVRTPEIIEQAMQLHEENPRLSIREMARELNISTFTAHKMRHEDMGHFAYKISTFQALGPNDIHRRLNFATEMCGLIDSKKLDIRRIIFTDEAHFHIDGYVNRQNYRIWGTEKPAIRTTPLHPRKVTVWAGICAKGIIGPIFLKQNETVDGAVYNRILQAALQEASEKHIVGNYYWQQDGAPAHRTGENLDLIHSCYKNRVIAKGYRERFGSGYEWPPYSPDMSAMDYFLWGYTKDSVYKTRPNDIEELEERIREVMRRIPREVLERAILASEKRLRLLLEQKGEHFENIIN